VTGERFGADPAAVVDAADAVRRHGDAIAAMVKPTPVDVTTSGPVEERFLREHLANVVGLQVRLADFEQARGRYDQQVFETLRLVSDHLAVIAMDAVQADTTGYVPLPRAGYGR
jgi:hypothetical protein